jgi:hypothetical protein
VLYPFFCFFFCSASPFQYEQQQQQQQGARSKSKREPKKKSVRRPGIEPGSTAWKATMLTITPATLSMQIFGGK